MNINNIPESVNSTAKNLLYSYIPFGSDYVIFTESERTYVLLLRRIGKNDVEKYTVSRVDANYDYYYDVVKSADISNYTGFTVEYPYYCYSNVNNCGIREVLPCNTDISTFMLLIVASVCVFRLVFGGIRLWRRKSSV